VCVGGVGGDKFVFLVFFFGGGVGGGMLQ